MLVVVHNQFYSLQSNECAMCEEHNGVGCNLKFHAWCDIHAFAIHTHAQ